MIGLNKIHFNQSTVTEALQEYLDKRYSPKIKVKRVVGQVINGHTETFEIEVSALIEDLEKSNDTD